MTGLEGNDIIVWVDGEPVEVEAFTQDQVDEFLQLLGNNSGLVLENQSLRTSVRAALKQVLENGADPTEAAKNIEK
jgi:hypothetical protein